MSKIEKYNEYSESLNNGFTEKKFIKFLKEGLIKTYPIKFVVRYLNKFLREKDITHFIVDFEDESIFIKLTKSKVSVKNVENIISVLNTNGYFPSLFTTYDVNDKEVNHFKYIKTKDGDNIQDVFNNDFYMIQIESEAKFNIKLKVPKKLYHLTNSNNLDKILKIGLVPKSKNKKSHHPERIYFGFNEIGCENLVRQFNNNKKEDELSIFSLLEIDTIGLNLEIYTDPDYYNGCWTSGNIPPLNIKVILKEIK
jgi:hypothetical protein